MPGDYDLTDMCWQCCGACRGGGACQDAEWFERPAYPDEGWNDDFGPVTITVPSDCGQRWFGVGGFWGYFDFEAIDWYVHVHSITNANVHFINRAYIDPLCPGGERVEHFTTQVNNVTGCFHKSLNADSVDLFYINMVPAIFPGPDPSITFSITHEPCSSSESTIPSGSP